MPQELRPYQVKALEQLRAAYRKPCKSALLVAPTGSGKTTIAAHIIDGAQRLGKRLIFLAHRKELIDQCSKRLDDQGVDHGIIKAGNRRVNQLPVQVASLMTLINCLRPRGQQQNFIQYRPECDIFIIDECHRARAKSYEDVMSFYPDAIRLGLTATPVRLDGQGLGEMFEEMVQASTVLELTEMGFLVPARVFTTPMTPDFSAVKKTGGDFDQKEVSNIVDKAFILGDVYTHWKKHAGDRQTVIFASSCQHGQHLTETFKEKGERAEYLDGETPEDERAAVLDRLTRRETQIVVNMGILTEGWDNPEIACCVLARPTQSMALYLQMAGRALRPAPWIGKTDCIILDHGGNTVRHGFVEDEREWSLDGKQKKKAEVGSVTTCKKCFAVFASKVQKCPNCGESPKIAMGARDEIKQVDGELTELNPKEIRSIEKHFLAEQLAIQEKHNLKKNYATTQFFKKFGRWPGREVGLVNKKWEETDDGNGGKRFRLTGYEIKGLAPLSSGHGVRERTPASA